MKRLFITVAIFVVVLNVGLIVYFEHRTRRTVAEVKASATELEKQQKAASLSVASNSTPALPQATSTTAYVPIPEDERGEDYIELESLDAFHDESGDIVAGVEEECCPEDDKEAYLSWEQKVRKDLTAKHGAIPEIDRYIELATVFRDGGNLTVSEVVEEIELRVMLYGVGHEELADTIEMAKNYPPNAIVKVKRESNDNSSAEAQPSDGTTTSTEYVPADN